MLIHILVSLVLFSSSCEIQESQQRAVFFAQVWLGASRILLLQGCHLKCSVPALMPGPFSSSFPSVCELGRSVADKEKLGSSWCIAAVWSCERESSWGHVM